LLLWQDAWRDGCSIADSAPDLVQAVPRHIRSSWTVADTLQNEAWIRDITGPCTVPVLMQYVQICGRLRSIVISHEIDDDLFVWR
jgi:hypothetical protein